MNDSNLTAFLIIVVITLCTLLILHDNTNKSNDIKLATLMVEYNVPIEKLEENKTLFENYESLREEYLFIVYNKTKAESRPNLEK